MATRWENILPPSDALHKVKREAVLREAGRIFSQRGFHNTSLDDVAKALNVSKGTLYNYVRDKQEILFECQKLALDIAARAFKAAEASGKDGANKLRLVMREYISMLTDELGACGIITEVESLRPADRAVVVAKRDQFDAQFVELIREGIADGSLRPVDPKLAIFTFMGAIHAVPGWFSPNGRLTGEEIADGVADFLMNGLSNVARRTTPTARKVARESPTSSKRRPKAG